MDVFIRSRKTINDLIDKFDFNGDRSIISKQVEDELLSNCLEFDNRIESLQDRLTSKIDELHEFMKQHLDLTKELNITKESAGCVIRCLNISLKSSCNVIARSIIEMIIRGEYTRICNNVEFIMNSFRRESNHSTRSRATFDLILEAQTRSFWKKLSHEQQEDAELFRKWHDQHVERNFFPSKDLLQRMWRRSKSPFIVNTIIHPKFGCISERNEVIENAFTNLYQTLSGSVHNSSLTFEEEVLPIPDFNGNSFKRADALALATFYSISMPNMRYEFITNVVDLPVNIVGSLADLQNRLNVSTTTINTTTNDQQIKSSKRKFQDEPENDDQQETSTDI